MQKSRKPWAKKMPSFAGMSLDEGEDIQFKISAWLDQFVF